MSQMASSGGAGDFPPLRRRQIFHHFSLTRDADTQKYMPYKRLAFPQLSAVTNKRTNVTELQNMWLVGFLDHEREELHETGLAELSHFRNMPGGRLLPGAVDHVLRLYRREEKKRRQLEQGRKAGAGGEQVDEVVAKLSRAQKRYGASAGAGSAGGSGVRLSDHDLLRLKELAKEFEDAGRQKPTPLAQQQRRRKPAGHGRQRGSRHKGARAGAKGGGGKTRPGGKTRSAGKGAAPASRRRVPASVYRTENRRLRRAMRERRPHPQAGLVRSRAMEDLYELEREQTEAAIKIQQAYQRYRRMCFWHSYLRKTRAATKIQAQARGMVARALIRRWYLRRTWLVMLVQASARGLISRKNSRRTLARERFAAVMIGRLVRGHLGRVRSQRHLERCAALRIQRLWRGCVGRACADRAWLNAEVIKMQSLVRGHLGRKRHGMLSSEMHGSAGTVQRVVRGMYVRQRRNLMLWDREMVRRRNFLKILKSEDEYMCEQAAKLKTAVKSKDLAKKIEAARRVLGDMHEKVRSFEWDYLSLLRERGQVSPRAVAQGWSVALDDNIKQHRTFTTNAKLETIFVAATKLRQLEIAHEDSTIALGDSERAIQCVRRQREAALKNMWDRESELKWREEAKNKMQDVADQRRRWNVKWFTKEGKPDKRRRPGMQWDASVYAGGERETFFIGGTNLFANGADRSGVPAKLGTNEGVNRIADEVALQNTANQLAQYSALLKPLFEGVTDAAVEVDVRGWPPPKPPTVEVNDAADEALLLETINARLEQRAAAALDVPDMADDAAESAEEDHDEVKLDIAGADSPGDVVVAPGADLPPRPAGEAAVKQRIEDRRTRGKFSSRIPWSMLDELDSEKKKLDSEKKQQELFLRRQERKLRWDA